MRWPSAALLLPLLSAALAAEPAQFRADAHHGGLYAGAGVPVLHGVKWKFRAGAAIVSSPAVSGGVVYLAAAITTSTPSMRAAARCAGNSPPGDA